MWVIRENLMLCSILFSIGYDKENSIDFISIVMRSFLAYPGEFGVSATSEGDGTAEVGGTAIKVHQRLGRS